MNSSSSKKMKKKKTKKIVISNSQDNEEESESSREQSEQSEEASKEKQKKKATKPKKMKGNQSLPVERNEGKVQVKMLASRKGSLVKRKVKVEVQVKKMKKLPKKSKRKKVRKPRKMIRKLSLPEKRDEGKVQVKVTSRRGSITSLENVFFVLNLSVTSGNILQSAMLEETKGSPWLEQKHLFKCRPMETEHMGRKERKRGKYLEEE